LLDQTLTRMRRMRVPDGLVWELLIVNNNCTDDTDQVIRRHAEALPIKRLFEPKPGLSNARNHALAHAAGDWVLWTDDDVLVDPDWLGVFVRATEEYPQAAAIGGLIEPWFPVPPDPALAEAFPILKSGYCGVDYGPATRILAAHEPIFGANMAYRSDFVRGLSFDPKLGRVKGFQGVGEDTMYHRAVVEKGGVVVWVPSMRLQHYVEPHRLTLNYLKRYFNDYGTNMVIKEGVPGGAKLLGVPRWLLRKYVTASVFSLYYRFTWRRRRHLAWMKERCVCRGMMKGCRLGKEVWSD
jgi:glycosyltransferase involved in cell wall biosynthesis